MTTPAIEVRDVSFAYGRTEVLRDVHLTIPEGDFVALIGPNGGGKTTLLKLMMGLLKPDTGSISLFGKPAAQARGFVGYVPQETSQNKEFPITVEETVLMGRINMGGRHRFYSNEDRRVAAETLERLGLTGVRREMVGELSGGQRQRALVARALVSQPRLLMLDEPVSSVDARWQSELQRLFADLNRDFTIVLVSHDMGVIARGVKSVACVSGTAHYHPSPEVTPEMLEKTYRCPVELIAHGVPHRVFPPHE